MSNMRLNDERRKILLANNNGFTTSTYYTSKNFSESRIYTIKNGIITVRCKSRNSDNEYILTDDEVKRFLRDHLWELDTTGIE